MIFPQLHEDPTVCPHSNGHACPACDFGDYYARTYPDMCPWAPPRPRSSQGLFQFVDSVNARAARDARRGRRGGRNAVR